MVIKRALHLPHWLTIIIFLVMALVMSGMLPDLWYKIHRETGYELTETCHDLYNFSIIHPQRWHPSLFGQAGVHGVEDTKLMILNGRSGSTIIIRYRPSQNPTLDHALSWYNETIYSLQRSPKFTDIETAKIIIGNNREAIRRVYRLKNRINEAILFTRHDGMFSISIDAPENIYEKDRVYFEDLVSSFSYCEED